MTFAPYNSRSPRHGLSRLLPLLLAGLLALELAPAGSLRAAPVLVDQVEPQAGTWRTWVLQSGNQLRRAVPPDRQATAAEIRQLKDLAVQRDAADLDQIAFWTTGGPIYRWNEIAINQALKTNTNTPMGARAMALVHVAIYDATIAAWDTKYAYNRLRPSEFDRSLTTLVPNPASPSYPSEHATVAGAAAAVLAYLFPTEAASFASQAEAVGQAQLLAGVSYPSDVAAGLELGRAVAELVIARAKTDGSNVAWTGSVPTGAGYWTGSNPTLPLAGSWKTWVLTSGSEIRPAPPPAYDSVQMATELAEVTSFARTPKTNADATFWEYASGGTRGYWFWNGQTTSKLWEYGLFDNPPRAARAYALESVAYYDAMVACWDAKYTYWSMRPFQLEPSFRPLFTTPNHPSYPSAHGCLSGAAGETLAWLFPRDAASLRALVDQAGESRIWAGIHTRSDVVVGLVLGRTVAWKVIERTQPGGTFRTF